MLVIIVGSLLWLGLFFGVLYIGWKNCKYFVIVYLLSWMIMLLLFFFVVKGKLFIYIFFCFVFLVMLMVYYVLLAVKNNFLVLWINGWINIVFGVIGIIVIFVVFLWGLMNMLVW